MNVRIPLYGQERDETCALACLRMVLAAVSAGWIGALMVVAVFVRIGIVKDTRRIEVAHLAAAHEISDELEALAIPNG